MATEAPTEYLSIGRVCDVTGLPRAEIYRAAELAQLGMPAHSFYRDGVVCYTSKGLEMLGQELQKMGHDLPARLLSAELGFMRARRERPRLSWAQRWEARQEGVA